MMEYYLVILSMMRNLKEMNKYHRLNHTNNMDMDFGQDF